jgi:hypothetical protein
VNERVAEAVWWIRHHGVFAYLEVRRRGGKPHWWARRTRHGVCYCWICRRARG